MERTTIEHQIGLLLRISAEMDIVGDVSVTLANPSDLIAWTSVLTRPVIMGWRASDSGRRYLQATAYHNHSPVHGTITAILPADERRQFWNTVLPEDLTLGSEQRLQHRDLVEAWTEEPPSPT